MRAWAAAGADIVMGGHIHLPSVLCLRELDRDLPRNVRIVQAGTALSTRVRHGAPNSVNLIRYSASEKPRGCRVECWDYQRHRQRFDAVEQVDIVLDDGADVASS